MSLNLEPSTPSEPPREPSTSNDALITTPRLVTSEGQQTSDAGAVRPLLVLLVVTALALAGSIVFALVHTGAARDLAQLTDARADVVQAVDEGRGAQDGLAGQIGTAEQILAASEGKVADDSVRTDLAAQVAAARKLGATEPPPVPEAGADGLDALDDISTLEAQAIEWTITMRTTSTALTEASQDVRAAHLRWQQSNEDTEGAQPASTAAELEAATARLTSVTAQLEISVRDSQYTLDWTATVGAPAGVRQTLATHRAEGEAALAAGLRPDDMSSVMALLERREAARAAIEAGAWEARTTVADGSNGRLEKDSLCKVGLGPEGQDQYLRCDAAEAWNELAVAFEAEFGKPLRVEYGYRPYDWQLQALDEFGSAQVAEPGTSNHGWALAVDVPVDDGFRFGLPEFEWLVANGPEAGWTHPEWARAGGGREEPWHFEYEK